MRRPVNLSAAYDYRLSTIEALESTIAGASHRRVGVRDLIAPFSSGEIRR